MGRSMKPKLDDVVAAAVVSAVATIFLAETIALWPEPMRLNEFKLVIENPFASPSKQPSASTRLASSSGAFALKAHTTCAPRVGLYDAFRHLVACDAGGTPGWLPRQNCADRRLNPLPVEALDVGQGVTEVPKDRRAELQIGGSLAHCYVRWLKNEAGVMCDSAVCASSSTGGPACFLIGAANEHTPEAYCFSPNGGV